MSAPDKLSGGLRCPRHARLLIGTGLRDPQLVIRPLQRRITYDHDSEKRVVGTRAERWAPHKFSSLHLRSQLLRNGALLDCKIVDLSPRGGEGYWQMEDGVGPVIGWGSRIVPGGCGGDPGEFKQNGRIELLEWSELK
jgi:hypothetical protein